MFDGCWPQESSSTLQQVLFYGLLSNYLPSSPVKSGEETGVVAEDYKYV